MACVVLLEDSMLTVCKKEQHYKAMNACSGHPAPPNCWYGITASRPNQSSHLQQLVKVILKHRGCWGSACCTCWDTCSTNTGLCLSKACSCLDGPSISADSRNCAPASSCTMCAHVVGLSLPSDVASVSMKVTSGAATRQRMLLPGRRILLSRLAPNNAGALAPLQLRRSILKLVLLRCRLVLLLGWGSASKQHPLSLAQEMSKMNSLDRA